MPGRIVLSVLLDAWEAAPTVPPWLCGRVRAAGGDKTHCAFSAATGALAAVRTQPRIPELSEITSWPPLLERNPAEENITPTSFGGLQFSNLKLTRGAVANNREH